MPFSRMILPQRAYSSLKYFPNASGEFGAGTTPFIRAAKAADTPADFCTIAIVSARCCFIQATVSNQAARKARTASGAERAKLWEGALKFWPPYADYQKKTPREIPVVVLDPV